ncbi:ABC transporter substrate-binding protein [Cohnella sp. WQ 127256]|uniref:ABC transporter substrate-binding protein n=1 Tax=Cohnella sp. WQ 127256 TaxID=2938790 RepID=UPI0021179A60|nr:ABC transporter substrate-binding protein [Cohnella sp. WQ 127256]
MIKKQRHYRKSALILTLMLVLTAILSACGGNKDNNAASPSTSAQASASAQSSGEAASKEPSGELTKVRLQLKWLPQTQFGGYFVALDKGYYKEEGLDVEILPGGPDIIPEQQVANGAADIGNTWVAGLLSHQEEGFPLIQIAQMSQKSGMLLISKKSAGINTPADLKGKKVGAWMGGLEFEILALLEKYNLDSTKDVTLTKQGFTMDQFLNNQLDAASALTHNEYPLVLAAGVSENDVNVIDMNTEGVAMLQDNLFANSEWLADNQETAVKFLRASFKGWKDAIANPEEATDIVMKSVDQGSTTREHQLTMMKAIGALVLPEGTDNSKIGYIDAAAFKQTADIALKFGVLKQEVDLSKAYTNEVWELATK